LRLILDEHLMDEVALKERCPFRRLVAPRLSVVGELGFLKGQPLLRDEVPVGPHEHFGDPLLLGDPVA
jgi:hypothetical protein